MEKEKYCKQIWDAGNPCLDLFYNIVEPRIKDACTIHTLTEAEVEARVTSLKHLLPLAWSKNSLTTLKLICKILCLSCPYDYYPYHLDDETFKTAVGWLHQNHSNTLACNINSIARLVGGRLSRLLCFLYHLLLQEEGRSHDHYEGQGHKHYRLLHNRVMDVLAEMLKSDIHKMKHNKLELKPFDFTVGVGLLEDEKLYTLDSDALDQLKVTGTAQYCITVDGHSEEAHAFRAIQLRESIATRLFPELKSKQDWERLHKEVLGPLTKYSRRQDMFDGRKRLWMKEYLEKVKAAAVAGGGNNIMKLDWDALEPALIIGNLGDKDLGKAAELQWNALVNHLKQEGKFKNSLALFDTPTRMQPTWSRHGGLGFLVSQLCDVEPWKGNVIGEDDMGKPELVLIQGDDPKSKSEFLRTTMKDKWNVDVLKVLEMILEVNVNENLKPEQMIKKLFVFHNKQTSIEEHKYEEYEAIRNKFKAKGYGEDAVPHIIFCQSEIEHGYIQQHRGFTLLEGKSLRKNLINLFLDKGGEIGPQHFMEACITDKEYQHLYVVD